MERNSCKVRNDCYLVWHCRPKKNTEWEIVDIRVGGEAVANIMVDKEVIFQHHLDRWVLVKYLALSQTGANQQKTNSQFGSDKKLFIKGIAGR